MNYAKGPFFISDEPPTLGTNSPSSPISRGSHSFYALVITAPYLVFPGPQTVASVNINLFLRRAHATSLLSTDRSHFYVCKGDFLFFFIEIFSVLRVAQGGFFSLESALISLRCSIAFFLLPRICSPSRPNLNPFPPLYERRRSQIFLLLFPELSPSGLL